MTLENIILILENDNDHRGPSENFTQNLLLQENIQLDATETFFFQALITVLQDIKDCNSSIDKLIKSKDETSPSVLLNKCDDYLLSISNQFASVDEIRDFIMMNTENTKDIKSLLRDSLTLLLSIWSISTKKLNCLKFKVSTLFIFSKCELLVLELSELNNHILSVLQSPNYDDYDDHYESLQKISHTTNSFNLFLTKLIKELNFSLVSNDFQENFNYYLRSFLRIEELYEFSNFNWLLLEIQSILQRENSPFATNHIQDEDTNSLNLHRTDSLQSSSTVTLSTYDGSYDKAFEPLSRRLSSSELTEVSESSPMNATTSILQRELPHLLNAFQIAKRVDCEVQNARSSNLIIDPKNQTSFHSIKALPQWQSPHSLLYNHKFNNSMEREKSFNRGIQNDILNNLYDIHKK